MGVPINDGPGLLVRRADGVLVEPVKFTRTRPGKAGYLDPVPVPDLPQQEWKLHPELWPCGHDAPLAPGLRCSRIAGHDGRHAAHVREGAELVQVATWPRRDDDGVKPEGTAYIKAEELRERAERIARAEVEGARAAARQEGGDLVALDELAPWGEEYAEAALALGPAKP